MSKQLFALGLLVARPAALKALTEVRSTGFEYVARHETGDWGDLSDEDERENDLSVQEGFRILSAYTLKTGAHLDHHGS